MSLWDTVHLAVRVLNIRCDKSFSCMEEIIQSRMGESVDSRAALWRSRYEAGIPKESQVR